MLLNRRLMHPNSLRDKPVRCILLRTRCIDFPSCKMAELRENTARRRIMRAMSFFSDTRETSARYGTYIAEFQELCKRHEVSSGTPEDFFRLAPKLAYDERFRADFCQLTKSVAQREEGRLTLTRILTIIAIAMGGEDIDTVGTAGAVPVSLVIVFLAGVGGWSENESDNNTAPAAMLVKGVSQEATPMASDLEEQEALALERKLASEPNNLGEMTASLFGGPAMVKEALCRLELNTLELKLHLDSIDNRMERIEPHLDDLTSRLEGDGRRPKGDAQRAKEQLPPIRYSQPVFRVAKGESNAGVQQDTKPPRSDKSEMRRLHRLVTALGVLLVVMAAVLGTLLYISHGRLMKAEIGRILAGTIDDAASKTANSSSSPVTKDTSPTGSFSTAPPASLRGAVGSPVSGKSQPLKLEPSVVVIPSGLGDAKRKINLPEKKEEEAPKAPAIHLADALPGAIATRSTDESGVRVFDATAPGAVPTSPTVRNTSFATGDKTPPNGADTRQKIFVPASTLVHNAIAQPPPAYPSLARIQKVEGDVLLQALVDEKGKVEAVTVVNGPEPLRNASIDALRNWRFKPYLLDGHPVAVRTFIDFHFKMNQ